MAQDTKNNGIKGRLNGQVIIGKTTQTADEQTEYQFAYEPWPFQAPPQPMRPPQRRHTASVPMDMNTTYTATYKTHEVTRRAVPAKKEYVPPNTPVCLTSTYKQDFAGKSASRTRSFKPDYKYAPGKNNFKSHTMYEVTYQQFDPDVLDWCRPAPIRHKECISISKHKFEGNSTMQEDYTRHENPERAHLKKPQAEQTVGGGEFEVDTTYKLEYTTKEAERIPAFKPKDHKPAMTPFVGTSTAKTDYQAYPNHQREPCFKPPMVYKPCKVPFDGRTTSTSAYKEWAVKRQETPHWASVKKYQPPRVMMHSRSSYQEDFKQPRSYEFLKAVQPGNGEKLSLNHGDDQTFADKTQYTEQYVEYKGVDQPKSFKIIQVYKTPKEPFMAESTYMACYRGEPTGPAEICHRTSQNTTMGDEPMCFLTTYEETYTQKKTCRSVCAATPLVIVNEKKVNAGEVSQTGSKTTMAVQSSGQDKGQAGAQATLSKVKVTSHAMEARPSSSKAKAAGDEKRGPSVPPKVTATEKLANGSSSKSQQSLGNFSKEKSRVKSGQRSGIAQAYMTMAAAADQAPQRTPPSSRSGKENAAYQQKSTSGRPRAPTPADIEQMKRKLSSSMA